MQEYAIVLIGGIWRACERPGEQWDARDMGISAGFGPNAMRRAAAIARTYQANRGGMPTNGNTLPLTSDANEGARTHPEDPAHGEQGLIMGDRLNSPRKESKPVPNIFALTDGRDIKVDDWGETHTRVDRFFIAVIRAIQEVRQDECPARLVMRRLLMDAVNSMPPEERDAVLVRALELADIEVDERWEREAASNA